MSEIGKETFVSGLLCKTSPNTADGGDSAEFSGFIYTQAEFCSQSFIHARPSAGNANRWAQ